MTYRIEKPKWIFYRHTHNLEALIAVAGELKGSSKEGISQEKKSELQQKLKKLESYKERNPTLPLDAINHRINSLAYYMFGYKGSRDNTKVFMFSPLGNLFLKHLDAKEVRSKIFLTMLWAIQFPHPHGGTQEPFNLFPFRLIFKLLTDPRLDNKLFAYEVSLLVVFIEYINSQVYEHLVQQIISLRKLSNDDLSKKFSENVHASVNAVYEWEYYVTKFLETIGVLNRVEGNLICKLPHGKNTYRSATRMYVELDPNIFSYCQELLKEYPFDQTPLLLNDPERLSIDVVKEIYSFYPRILLIELGILDEASELQSKLLDLPKLIEQSSHNNEENSPRFFEEVLTEGFNLFKNVNAKRIGGAANTDIECLYMSRKKKFAVDAKSTQHKLTGINSGRLRAHREKISGEYTIVITPGFVPAVHKDIAGNPIVIILASTFAEYLYNYIDKDSRNLDYEEIDYLIVNNLGKDISSLVSKLTIDKFSVNGGDLLKSV